MATEMKKQRQHEQGFTLAFTIMLTVVLSLAAIAIMTKVFVSTRQSGFTKEHQNTMDAAVIGLNMAIDEISPGMDRMRNAVWTSAVSNVPPAAGDDYPNIALTQTQLKSTGASADTPVRELSLVGNIRNWEAFANWGGTTKDTWNKGWEFVASNPALEYFDATPGQTGKATVSVGSQNLSGGYWYKQLEPKPPTLAEGAPDVPILQNGTKLWPNTRGGIYGNEYPYGLFCQPVLRKVYQVRQNPIVRVAVYVRMSLQDYYGVDTVNGQIAYSNRHMDGRTIPIQGNMTGMDNASASFDGRNFLETNAITFSVFAVSEGTTDSKGVRIHQALNVTLGGAEYISGRSARITPSGRNINANGLENVDRLYQGPGAATLFRQCLSPYFAPALDTPSGNSQLTAFSAVTGQVYPASADLTLNFSTRPATEQVVFLYEHIKLAGADDAQVVFLIEQVPPGVNGNNPYWRRRLLWDYPRGYSSPLWDDGGGPNKNYPMMFSRASFSVDPWTNSAGFPSMLWWANKVASTDVEHNPSVNTVGGKIPLAQTDEHFYYTNAPTLFGTTAQRYPFTARLDRFGTFVVGTQSAPVKDNVNGDVVKWPNNPLLDYTRTKTLDANMPWQGPTVPYSQAAATVSYVATTWPMRAWSTVWANQGGGVGIPFTAATWSVY